MHDYHDLHLSNYTLNGMEIWDLFNKSTGIFLILERVNHCRVMFWSDWNREAPKIETAHMDGSQRQALVTENLGLPNGLAIDYDTHLVCWADAGQ